MRKMYLQFLIVLWMAWGLAAAAQTASWTATGLMPVARTSHTMTLLANGKVLVAGGYNGSAVTINAALYDPATGAWASTGAMPTPHYGHTATLLANGKVLVAGGYNGSAYVATAALYDPATGTWAATGAMPTPHYGHTATLLANGKVLVAGGYSGSAYTASAALYDPATGTWTATGAMPTARGAHTMTLLTNGKVLVAGGGYSSGGNTGNWVPLASAALYDPATGAWTATGAMPAARSDHTATLLANGKVLVAGGGNGSGEVATAALYDPATGVWAATGAMPAARLGHTATLLGNGKVLVAGGGYSDSGNVWHDLDSAALYDPPTGVWTATASLLHARDSHTAILLDHGASNTNGKVLVAGGYYYNGSNYTALASAELYTPDTGGPNDPDFVVSAITLTPDTVDVGGTFSASVTVKNLGKTAGNGGALLVWANLAGAAACGQSADQSASIGNLAAGASTTLTFTGLKAATTSGAKTFRAYADGNCATLESNDANNQRTASYRVRGSLPDFTVSAISLPATAPKAGSYFSATVTVKNQGAADGNAGYVDVWADQPNAQPCQATGDAWASVGAVAAGASKTVTVKLLAGSAGAKTFRAFANSWCGTVESDLSNNQQTQGYSVQ